MLHFAAAFGHAEFIRALLQLQPEPNLKHSLCKVALALSHSIWDGWMMMSSWLSSVLSGKAIFLTTSHQCASPGQKQGGHHRSPLGFQQGHASRCPGNSGLPPC